MKHIEPYVPRMSAKENTRVEPKFDIRESLVERVETPRRSFISPDDDSKDIKNIYVDSKLLFLSLFMYLLICTYRNA